MLDAHFVAKWEAHTTPYQREAHRKRGGATYRIVRYADDFVIMVAGTKAHADALWDAVAQVIAPLGLRLSVEKSRVCHLDEGFDFLGFRIQRRRRKGTSKMSVYTYPSKKALASIMAKGGRSRRKHVIMASLISSDASIRCFEDGVRISVTVSRSQPSGISIPLPGIGSLNGCSSGTSESRGRISTGGS